MTTDTNDNPAGTDTDLAAAAETFDVSSDRLFDDAKIVLDYDALTVTLRERTWAADPWSSKELKRFTSRERLEDWWQGFQEGAWLLDRQCDFLKGDSENGEGRHRR